MSDFAKIIHEEAVELTEEQIQLLLTNSRFSKYCVWQVLPTENTWIKRRFMDGPELAEDCIPPLGNWDLP